MKTRFLPFTLLLLTLSWNSLQAQWTGLGTGISAPPRSLFGLSVVNENIVWGFSWDEINIAPSKEFTRTLDGGQTWIPGFLDEVDAGLYSGHVFAFNADTAWLSTSSLQNPVTGKVYKTTDGGETWVWVDTLFNGFNQAPTAIHFFDAEKGVAFGAPFSAFYNNQILIYTTSDGGNSWTEVAVPPQLAGEGITDRVANGVYAAIGSEIWFPSTKGRVFKSSDYGNTWAAYQAPLQGATPHDPISIAMKDHLNGLLISDNPNEAFRTTDGGETWIPIAFPSQPAAFQVEYIPETEGTYIIHDGFFHNSPDILVTYDDGESWQIIATNVSMESLEFLSPTLGFGCTAFTHPNFGGMYKWSGPSLSGRIFVNDDAIGANTGYNWADAFTDLQSAFAIAEAGDQIWVAEGTYKPATTGGPQTATFLIDEDLRLYGGFVGTETSLSHRGDPADHPAILSGDVNGNDVPDDFSLTYRSDNVLHVLTVNSNITNETLIDGFIVEGGQADGASGGQKSGVEYVLHWVSVMNQCTFRQNYVASDGEGSRIYASSGNPTIFKNCVFEKNQGSLSGAVQISQPSSTSFGVSIDFDHCTFTENKAFNGEGGGLQFWPRGNNSYLKVNGCEFTGNSGRYNATEGFYALLMKATI
ncbi:MAG: hypothetical protein IPN76_03570 [Saprospiraceae bacterium]|nr:hypothetical protein [Saprospiraceae bacterium]